MLQFCDCISRMPNTVTFFFFFGRRLFFFFWFRKQKCCDVLQLLRVSSNPLSIDISDSALLSLSLLSCLLLPVIPCRFLFVCSFVCFFPCCAALFSLCFFFFSVECALHLSLVVRISSRGALQKEKVAIADLHLFLSFFFFCLFVCLLF